MKNFEIIGGCPIRRRSELRHHFRAGRRTPEFAHDDAVIRVRSAGDDAQCADQLAQLHIALTDNVILVEDKQIATALILLQGAVRYQQRTPYDLAHWQADLDEHTRQQRAIWIAHDAPHQQGARLRVDCGATYSIVPR